MQGKTIADLVILIQVLPNGIYNQAKEIRVLVHQQGNSKVTLTHALSITRTVDLFLNLTICFSPYLELDMRLTASMCPTSTLYPRMYVKMIFATYLQHY